MPKIIAVTESQVENNDIQQERKLLKELNALLDALDKPAFDVLTAAQRNELVRRSLVVLVKSARRAQRASIQAQKAQ